MPVLGPALWATIAFFGAIGLLAVVLVWIGIEESAHSPQALTEESERAPEPDQ